jgi:hypothetical protein
LTDQISELINLARGAHALLGSMRRANNLNANLRNFTSSKVKLVIHHQCPGIELIAPMYIGYSAAYHSDPRWRVNSGSTMQTYLMPDLPRGEPIYALMYKLKKNNTDEFNEATCTQLVMIWKVDELKGFHLVPLLIEHDKSCVWDRNKLVRLARKYTLSSVPYTSIEDTWLMHDDIALMMRVNVTHEEEYYKLELTISEANIRDDTQRPQYIDVDR